MNKSEFLALAEKELKDILELIKRKNSDYSGGSDDALANFRMCENVGLAGAETGVLIRMMDKVQRIKSYLAKGSLEVPGESAKDAIRDIIGYSVALLALVEEMERDTRIIVNKNSGVTNVSDTVGSITWETEISKTKKVKHSGAV
jgi:hypothetical protein